MSCVNDQCTGTNKDRTMCACAIQCARNVTHSISLSVNRTFFWWKWQWDAEVTNVERDKAIYFCLSQFSYCTIGYRFQTDSFAFCCCANWCVNAVWLCHTPYGTHYTLVAITFARKYSSNEISIFALATTVVVHVFHRSALITLNDSNHSNYSIFHANDRFVCLLFSEIATSTTKSYIQLKIQCVAIFCLFPKCSKLSKTAQNGLSL